MYPLPSLRATKFWPTTSRLNDTYGDRNLVCSCPPIETFLEAEDEQEGDSTGHAMAWGYGLSKAPLRGDGALR